jgi:hypothetical protein
VEEVRVETICLGRDVAVKAVEALKKYVCYSSYLIVLCLYRTVIVC